MIGDSILRLYFVTLVMLKVIGATHKIMLSEKLSMRQWTFLGSTSNQQLFECVA